MLPSAAVVPLSVEPPVKARVPPAARKPPLTLAPLPKVSVVPAAVPRVTALARLNVRAVVLSVVKRSVPALRVTTLAGPPREPSPATARVPPLSVSPPVNVLAALESVSVPLPVLSSPPAPETTPENVVPALLLTVKVALAARLVAPVKVNPPVVPSSDEPTVALPVTLTGRETMRAPASAARPASATMTPPARVRAAVPFRAALRPTASVPAFRVTAVPKLLASRRKVPAPALMSVPLKMPAVTLRS